MTRVNYADVVRRLVRQARADVVPGFPTDRRRLVSAVEQALRARSRRRSARRSVGLGLAAAAIVAVVGGGRGLWHRSTGQRAEAPHVARPDRALTVLDVNDAEPQNVGVDPGQAPGQARGPEIPGRGMALGAGIRLTAPASDEVHIGTAEGTLLSLEPGGDLTITEASETQRFALKAGAVRARVARLSAGERFIIDTTDAEIEVHGTAFRVAVVASDPSCGAGIATRVAVSDGVVSVRAAGREARVYPGGTWPEHCETPIAAVEAVRSRSRERAASRAAPPSHERPAAQAAPQPRTATAAPVRPIVPRQGSDLAEQNDLFAAAVRAKRQGQLAEAARMFGTLATEHPSGPLVESAMVQHMKILGALGSQEAARAATDYLARFPNGYARSEAETLVVAPAP